MSNTRFTQDFRDGYHVFSLGDDDVATGRGKVAAIVARQTRAAEVSAWCQNEFGPPGPNAIWAYSPAGAFFFNDETHALIFKLRWC